MLFMEESLICLDSSLNVESFGISKISSIYRGQLELVTLYKWKQK